MNYEITIKESGKEPIISGEIRLYLSEPEEVILSTVLEQKGFIKKDSCWKKEISKESSSSEDLSKSLKEEVLFLEEELKKSSRELSYVGLVLDLKKKILWLEEKISKLESRFSGVIEVLKDKKIFPKDFTFYSFPSPFVEEASKILKKKIPIWLCLIFCFLSGWITGLVVYNIKNSQLSKTESYYTEIMQGLSKKYQAVLDSLSKVDSLYRTVSRFKKSEEIRKVSGFIKDNYFFLWEETKKESDSLFEEIQKLREEKERYLRKFDSLSTESLVMKVETVKVKISSPLRFYSLGVGVKTSLSDRWLKEMEVGAGLRLNLSHMEIEPSVWTDGKKFKTEGRLIWRF